MQVDILQDFFILALKVCELNIIEVDGTILHLLYGVFGIGYIGLFIQHLADTLYAGGGHGDHYEYERKHHQRHESAEHIAEQLIELAHGKAAANHIMCAEPAYAQHGCVVHEHHDGVIECNYAFRLDQHIIKVARGFRELLLLVVLTDICLYDPYG